MLPIHKQYKTFEEDTVDLAAEVGFTHTDTWWLSLSTQQGGSAVSTLDGVEEAKTETDDIWVDTKDQMYQGGNMSLLSFFKNKDKYIDKYRLDTWAFIVFMIVVFIVAIW